MVPGKTNPWLGRNLICGVVLSCAFTQVSGCKGEDVSADDTPTIDLGLFTRGDDGFNDEANVSMVLMALREINEAGGLTIDGVDYVLDLETAVFEDASAATASAAFALLAEAGVAGVLGPPWSSQLLGSVEEQDGVWRRSLAHGIVTISESATSSLISDLEDDGFVFRMMPPDSVQAVINAQEIWDTGHESVALLYREDSYAIGLVEQFRSAYEALGGAIVADTSYDVSMRSPSELGVYDFDVELDAVFSSSPDLVYLVTFDELVQISRRIEERDDIASLPSGDVAFFGPDSLYDPATLQSASLQLLNRLRGTAAGFDPSSADYGEFSEALETAGLGAPWSAAAQLYDAVYVFALAMQAAGSADPSVYKDFVADVTRSDPDDVVVYVNEFSRARDALLSGRGVNYEGASGPIELNDVGDPASGTFLVWRPVLSGDGEISFETEKLVPF